MARPGRKELSLAKYVERWAWPMLLETISRQITWKEYLFHAITVIRLALQERLWESTKLGSINSPFSDSIEINNNVV